MNSILKSRNWKKKKNRTGYKLNVLFYFFFCLSLLLPTHSHATDKSKSTPKQETKPIKEKKLAPELIHKKNEILTKIMKYGTANERREAIHAIVEFEERNSNLYGYISQIMMTDPDQSLRITAINSLVKMEIKTEESNFYKLLEDENEDMILQSLFAIKRMSLMNGANHLITLISKRDLKKNDNITIAAIEALAEIDKGHKAYSFLTEHFKNHDNNAQVRAAIALYYGSTNARQSEILMLDTANDKREETTIRCYAINTLGNIKSSASIPHLKKILEESRKDQSKTGSKQNQTLKIYTLNALVKLGDKSVKEELFSFAKDNDPVVRLRAIKFLEDLDDPEVIEILEYKSQRDPSNKVQAAAAAALEKRKKKP